MEGWVQIIETEDIRVALDLAAGHFRSLEIKHDGHLIKPLHTASWIDEPAIQNDPLIPVVLKHLSAISFAHLFGQSVRRSTDHAGGA